METRTGRFLQKYGHLSCCRTPTGTFRRWSPVSSADRNSPGFQAQARRSRRRLAGHSIRLELDIGIWLTVCARLTLSEWRWEPVRGGLVRPVRPVRCAVEVEVTVGQEEVRAAGDEIRGRCAAVGVAARVARRICRLGIVRVVGRCGRLVRAEAVVPEGVGEASEAERRRLHDVRARRVMTDLELGGDIYLERGPGDRVLRARGVELGLVAEGRARAIHVIG